MRTAEAVKLTENIFRCVNIALVNELKIVFSKMDIDVWEVIAAAETKPFGFMPFYPGPGLGGHCIPIDPFYLTWKAREFGCATRFIELAGEINSSMPGYVIDILTGALNERAKSVKSSKILVVGMAYKKNVGDMRESPACRLMALLMERGAQVNYYDPYIPEIGAMRDYPQLEGKKSIDWDLKLIADHDVTLIATAHDDVDYEALVEASALVIDTRNATAGIEVAPGKVIKA